MNAWDYLYLPPSANVVRGKTATSTAGTPGPDNPVNWLVDDRPSFPARWAAGAWGADIALGSAHDIQLVVAANHSLDADVTTSIGTLVPPTALGNGIRRNPYVFGTTPTSLSTLALSGTNTAAAIIGNVFAGVPLALPPLKLGTFWEEPHDHMPDDVEGDFMNMLNFDDGIEFRMFGGSQTYTEDQKEDIEEWYLDQRSGSRPSVIILNQAKNDARVVLLRRPRFVVNVANGTFDADLSWIELPRYRWVI